MGSLHLSKFKSFVDGGDTSRRDTMTASRNQLVRLDRTESTNQPKFMGSTIFITE